MTSAHQHAPSRGFPVSNRIRAILVHVPWYAIEGRKRLANDCGVAHSTIVRLCNEETNPSYSLASRVTKEIEKRLGVPLDMREVFTNDGTYPTARVCDLTPFCHGCFPDHAYDSESNLKPDYQRMQPGDWCTYPASQPTNLPTPSA